MITKENKFIIIGTGIGVCALGILTILGINALRDKVEPEVIPDENNEQILESNPDLINADYYTLFENSKEFRDFIEVAHKTQGAHEFKLSTGERYVYLSTGPITDEMYYFVSEQPTLDEETDKVILNYGIIPTVVEYGGPVYDDEEEYNPEPYGILIRIDEEFNDKELSVVKIAFEQDTTEQSGE